MRTSRLVATLALVGTLGTVPALGSRGATGTLPVGAQPVASLPLPSVPAIPSVPEAPSVPAIPSLPSTPSGSSGQDQVSANGPSGMNLTAAWQHFTTGSPGIVIAYVEGGINWHLGEARQLVNHIYVNFHELPIPCVGTTLATATMTVNGVVEACRPAYSTNIANYDIDHDGVVNAEEWAHDPRVKDLNGNGYIDPEDLIAAFSCYDRFTETIGTASWPGGKLACSNGAQGISNDGSAYPHAISGWNFYRGGNDPATADAAYTHSDDQMSAILSACPQCTIMPIKAGAEALDTTNELAKAWLFACQSGVSVIDSVTADIGYSSFMRSVISYCHSRGVVMVQASNDFDSTDHQGGMYWPHVVPGNGAVPDPQGTGWVRSDFTSWGTHSYLTVAGSSTTSQSTAEMGGLVGLLLSWGLKAYSEHLIPHPLTGPEALQVLRATARPVHDTRLTWPGAPGGWSLQYGYGIPDLARAMQAVAADRLPPVTSISSPDWYRLYDPTRITSVPITGRITAPGGGRFHWVVQAALGAQPSGRLWRTIGTGQATGSYSGKLATFYPSIVPKSFWAAPFRLSQSKLLSSTEQYAVTLRVIATDSRGLSGQSRRAVNVVHDGSWMHCFPMAIGSSGESQPALVDLQGTGNLDIVFGTSNGQIDAIDPVTCKELPGWPVDTAPVSVAGLPPGSGIDPGHQPIVADVAVGDLFHTGHLDVVATTLEGDVYAFDAHGKLLPGWPKSANANVAGLGVPRPNLSYTHLTADGTIAPPVLAHLAGSPGTLDVVQVAWDGEIHAWTPDGRDVAGWPVKPPAPSGQLPPGYVALDNQKLITAPAVAYLFGKAAGPDLVVRSEVTWVDNQTSGVGDFAFAYAYSSSGKELPGWPVRLPGLLELTDDAMEFLLEGSYQPTAVPIAAGVDDVAIAPVLTPPYLVDGLGKVVGTYGSFAPGAAGELGSIGRVLVHPASGASQAGRRAQESLSGAKGFVTDPGIGSSGGIGTPAPGSLSPDVPVPLGSSGAFGMVGGMLSYAQSETGLYSAADALLLQPNGGKGIQQYESLFPSTGGTERPGFPAPFQGVDFFGTPIMANVAANGLTDVVESGDSSALAAYGPLGTMVPGFPKWTTGWSFYAPSAGSLYANGRTDLVLTTREGYLFAWSTGGHSVANNQWWRAGHDEYNSDRYGTHSRPPGVPRHVEWHPGGHAASVVTFEAPGSRWYTGRVDLYRVTFGMGRAAPRSERVQATAPAGERQDIEVPGGAHSVTIQAVNRYGLLGRPITVR